jgi:hypothetical protein
MKDDQIKIGETYFVATGLPLGSLGGATAKADLDPKVFPVKIISRHPLCGDLNIWIIDGCPCSTTASPDDLFCSRKDAVDFAISTLESRVKLLEDNLAEQSAKIQEQQRRRKQRLEKEKSALKKAIAMRRGRSTDGG